MKAIFYKAFQPNATKLDKAIAVCSLGIYSHVELVFDDEVCFSVSARDGGARFKKININTDSWDSINLNITEESEKDIRRIAKTFTGYKYDYLGALFSITPVCIQKDDRIFCSEIVTNLLDACVRYRTLGDGCRYSPNKLYKELKRINNAK